MTPRRAALLGAAMVWIACLAYLSLRAAPRLAPGSMFHRVEHVVAFALLGLLVLPLSRSRAQEWIVVLAMLCLGAALEMRQHQIFRRVAFEWWDVRDDGVGLLLALLTVRFTRTRDTPQ